MKTHAAPPRDPRPAALRHSVPRHKSISLIGASIGLLAFLLVGLFPSLVLGGSTGAQLASGLHGVRDAPGSGASVLMVLGAVSTAIVGAAFVSALGAAVGSIVGVLISGQAMRQDAPPSAHGKAPRTAIAAVIVALALAVPAGRALADDAAVGGTKANPAIEDAGSPAARPLDDDRRRYAPYDESDLLRARRSVGALQRADPGFKRLLDQAVGYAVFAEMGTSDGSGGVGVLYEDGQASGRAILHLPPASLRSGGQPYTAVIFFGTRRAVATFKQDGLDAVDQARAVAIVPGRPTRIRYVSGVSVFTLSGAGNSTLGGADGVTEDQTRALAFRYLPYHRDITAKPR